MADSMSSYFLLAFPVFIVLKVPVIFCLLFSFASIIVNFFLPLYQLFTYLRAFLFINYVVSYAACHVVFKSSRTSPASQFNSAESLVCSVRSFEDFSTTFYHYIFQYRHLNIYLIIFPNTFFQSTECTLLVIDHNLIHFISDSTSPVFFS